MSEQALRLTVDGAIATLLIARPEKLNALDLSLLKALSSLCDEIETNTSIRVVVLRGEGKAFSAGGDIKAWGGMQPNEFGHEWVRFGHRVFDRLAQLRVPLIAALNGHALGGGLELAAVADIRIATRGIKIGLPETGLGMVPGWSGTQRLARRFGTQIIRRMVLGGEMFTADEALLHGIVDAVVEADQLDHAVQDYADRISKRGPAATEIAKLMLAAHDGENTEAAIEVLASILAAKTADLKEGVASFVEKRPAKFEGKW